MIGQLELVLKRLTWLRDNLNAIIQEVVIKERKFIAELNKDQLRKGEKADGSDMPNYVANSKSPSAPGKIKLFDTGDFYDGITPIVEDDEFDMIGFDDKTNLLTWKYGNEILGLTEESIDKLRIHLKPKIEALIIKKMEI